MTRLRRAELETALELVGIACELEGTDPLPPPFLDAVRRAVDAAGAEHQVIDRRRRVFISDAFVADGVTEVGVGPDVESLFWNLLDSCPTFAHFDRTGDRAVVRASDLASRTTYHELAFYREILRPGGVEWLVAVPLPAPPGIDRTLFFDRPSGASDFSTPTRDLLAVLQPHLARMVELAALRRRVAGIPVASRQLTDREREILDLVAQGKTNAQIATLLWVAPSTVKKHLENVYEKLGVANRAAAVATAGTNGAAS